MSSPQSKIDRDAAGDVRERAGVVVDLDSHHVGSDRQDVRAGKAETLRSAQSPQHMAAAVAVLVLLLQVLAAAAVARGRRV
jgi:hypothetical protein